MAFFPRFFSGEVVPIFGLLDEYTNQINTIAKPNSCPEKKSSSTFQPKFDVKENKQTFELYGELPGVDQKDVSIEFTDGQILSIHGQTRRFRTEEERPTSSLDGRTEQSHIDAGDATESYHAPTVEDETSTSTEKSSEEVKKDEAAVEAAPQIQQQRRPKVHASKYWLSERSVGEFSRAFSFPTRIDQEGVKASLRDGILRIIVPKAAAPRSRQVNIE